MYYSANERIYVATADLPVGPFRQQGGQMVKDVIGDLHLYAPLHTSQTGGSIFVGTPLETVYVVDEDTKTAYQTGYLWSRYEIVVMPTGIEEVETDKTAPTIVGYYDLNGKRINGKQRGAVIVRYSDGTTRKVLK